MNYNNNYTKETKNGTYQLEHLYKADDVSDISDGTGNSKNGSSNAAPSNESILLLNQNIECLKQTFLNANSISPSSNSTGVVKRLLMFRV